MTTDTEEPTNIKAACWAIEASPVDPEFFQKLGRGVTELLQLANRNGVVPLKIRFRCEGGKTFARIDGSTI